MGRPLLLEGCSLPSLLLGNGTIDCAFDSLSSTRLACVGGIEHECAHLEHDGRSFRGSPGLGSLLVCFGCSWTLEYEVEAERRGELSVQHPKFKVQCKCKRKAAGMTSAPVI